MSALPGYLARVNPKAAASGRAGRKRAALASETAKPVDSSLPPRAKKIKAVVVQDPADSSALESGPSVTVPGSEKVAATVYDSMATCSMPSGSSAPTTAPMPEVSVNPARIQKLPRGQVWEKGVTEELDVAFLPPRQFMDCLPLPDNYLSLVHESQKFLCKSIGLHQALIHLKIKYV